MYDLVWIYYGAAEIIESGLSFDQCSYLVEYLYQFAGDGTTLACEVVL